MDEVLLKKLSHLDPGDVLANLEGDYGKQGCFMVVLDRHQDGGLELSCPASYTGIARLPNGPFYLSPEGSRAIFTDSDHQVVFFVSERVRVLKGMAQIVLSLYGRLVELESSRRNPHPDDDEPVIAGNYGAEAKLILGLLVSEAFENDIIRTETMMNVLDLLPLHARNRILSIVVAWARGTRYSEIGDEALATAQYAFSQDASKALRETKLPLEHPSRPNLH